MKLEDFIFRGNGLPEGSVPRARQRAGRPDPEKNLILNPGCEIQPGNQARKNSALCRALSVPIFYNL